MPTSSRRTVALAGLVIDGTGRDPIRDGAIVIEEGRIQEVGPRSRVKVDRSNSLVLDLADRVVLPGLVDSHCHFWHLWTEPGDLQHRPHDPPAYIVARAIRNAGLWLDMGVTTAREVATPQNLDVGLRDAINAGVVRGPRLFVSGSGLGVTGGMYGKQAPFRRQVIELTGADEARRVTRQQIDAGVDLVKLFATAGVGERGHPQMTFEEIQAAVYEAHKAGRTVAAHAHATEGIKLCLQGGIDTLEHGKYLDEEAVAMMVARGVALVPTVSVGRTIATRAAQLGRGAEVVENARRALEGHRRSVRLAHGAGIKIVAGTDPAYADTMATECANLVDLGLSPMETIVAATRSGAEILNRAEDFGTIEVGKRADLVALAGNPLDRIAALAEVDYVMKDGVVVREPA
jgi:imidazolonepropionase-like amidohydrolase